MSEIHGNKDFFDVKKMLDEDQIDPEILEQMLQNGKVRRSHQLSAEASLSRQKKSAQYVQHIIDPERVFLDFADV